METKLLVCLVLVAAASAGPVMRNGQFPDFEDIEIGTECARQCKAKPTKFHYEPKQTYVYNYKTEAETTVAGAAEDKAKMTIEATALIDVVSQCEFTLRLKQVKVYHTDSISKTMKPAQRMREFQYELSAKDLRFSFDDGVIRDICHNYAEKIWVLNFKRGLLSAFQNSMQKLNKDEQVKEVDVSGDCQAEYSSKKADWWSGSTKVTKTKDLLACSNRTDLKTLIPMVPYHAPSEIQSLPIMKSSHECEQELSTDKIIKSSVCTESHVFAPFSNHQSGASTHIKQSLTLRTKRQSRQSPIQHTDSEMRSNLLFQHMNGIDEIVNSKQVAEKKIEEICEQTKMEIRPETPRLFTELVRIVKEMSKEDLRNMYNDIKSQRICPQNNKAKKFFLDALPIAQTTAAVEVMVEVINADEISEIEKLAWLNSFSLIPEPSEAILPSLSALLSGNSADQALLPVSVVLNTLCTKKMNCEQSYEFKKIIQQITKNIDRTCSNEDRSTLLKSLRAIGNIGCGNDLATSLRTCIKSYYSPLEVKVAAVDAFRRFQCKKDEEMEPLFEVYEDETKDSELRIMSFLSLMRCRTKPVLQRIAKQHNKEKDVSVGTFVWTHLQNVKESSDPHKQEAAQTIRYLQLTPFEGGWTSRNFEASALLNKYNVGYVADSDLIWSQSSVIPRAMRVNLTVEMFGNAINFFEAGARVNGIDHFVEKYFGVDGYFPKTKSDTDDIEAFIYGRMFGNELFFKNVKGTEELKSIKSKINLNNLLELISKDYDFKYTHSQQLFDDSFIIPTSIGLPINMTVNSTVTVNTEAKGNIDISGFLSHLMPIDVTTELSASAGFEVTGSMMVDAYLYKQGMRMRNTLHSSIHVKSNLKVKERQIVSFEIESPEEKQEIFNAKSQFFVIHDNVEKEQEMIVENRKEIDMCTGDKFAKMTGMKMCGEVNYPNATEMKDAPFFPFTGPVGVSVFLSKVDTQRSYNFFAKYIKNSKKIETQIQLDTPGSQVNRHISVDLTVGTHKNPHVDMILMSPWKKVIVNGKAAKSNELVSLTGSVVVDDDAKYKLTSEVKLEKDGKMRKYFPLIELEHKGQRNTVVSGAMSYTTTKSASMDLIVKDWNQQAYSVQGEIVNDREEKKFELSAGKKDRKQYTARIGTTIKVSKQDSVEIKPEVLIETPRGVIVALKSAVEYEPTPLRLSGKLNLDAIRMKKPIIVKVDLDQKGRNSYPIKVKVFSPIVSGDLKGKIELRKNGYISGMKLNYKTSGQKESITWIAKALNRSKYTYTQYNLNSIMKFSKSPKYNTATSLEISSKKQSSAELKIFYGDKPKNKDKMIQIVGSVNKNIMSIEVAKLKASLEARMPEKNVDIVMQVDHAHTPKKIDSELTLHLVPLIKKDIKAAFRMVNKTRSLHLINAEGKLEVGNSNFVVKSDLVQKSKKRMEHTLVVTSSEGVRHSVITEYSKDEAQHQLVSDIESTSLIEPLKVEAITAWKQPTNFHVKGAVKQATTEVYAVEVLSKLEKDNGGKWIVEVAHPERKMKAEASFNNGDMRIDVDAKVNWDMESREYPKPEIEINGLVSRISESDAWKSNLKIVTPFKNYEKLSSSLNFKKSESEIRTAGRVQWGSKKMIASEITAQLPLSIENTKVTFKTNTPFKHFKNIEMEVDHSFDSELNTKVVGKLGRQRSELSIAGKKEKSYFSNSNKIEGNLKLNIAKVIDVNLVHSQDDKELKSSLEINKDGEMYKAEVASSSETGYYNNKKTGKLTISGPEIKTETSFTLENKNGKSIIQANVDSSKNRRKQMNIDINGSFLDINHISFDVDVKKSPIKSLKEVGVQFNHQLDNSQIKSKVIIVKGNKKTGYDIQLNNKQQEISCDIQLLMSPPISLKSQIQYDNYPHTISTQITWGPTSTIELSGSLQAQHRDDAELNLHLTTPYEGLERIQLVASNKMKNSLRTTHLNIDYASKTMVDIEVQHQNTNKKKILRIVAETPILRVNKLETGISIDLTRGISTKAQFELELEQEGKYLSVFNLKSGKNDKIQGNFEIQTPLEGLKHIEVSISQNERDGMTTTSLVVSKDDVKLVDIKAETQIQSDYVVVKVISQGEIVHVAVEKVGILIPFLAKFDKDMNGNQIKEVIMQFNLQQDDKVTVVEGSLTADYGPSLLQPSFKVRKTGNRLNDFAVDVILANGVESLEANVVLKLVDNIKVQALLKDPFGKKHGVEFAHSQSTEKSETKGRVYLHELRDFESSFDLLMSSIQHVELTATTKSDVRGFELNTLKYTHEGQDNRVSCSLSVEDINGVIASVDLVGQSSPINLFSLIVNTPIKAMKKVVINADFDETKVNGLVMVNEKKQISLSGVHSNFKNPKVTLKTPLSQLQKLTVDVDGKLNDGAVSFELQFDGSNEVDGKIAMKLQNPAQVDMKAVLNSKIDETVNKLNLEIKTEEDSTKVSHFLLALNEKNQFKYESRKQTTDQGHHLELQVLYPDLELQTKGLVFNLDGDRKEASGKIQVLGEIGKMLDADIEIKMKNNKKASLIVREPTYMEYTFTQQNLPNTEENELSLKWDRDDADASVVVRAVLKDESDSKKVDRLTSLTFSCPKRSVGVEHALTASSTHLHSAAKIFWNKGRESELAYDIHLTDTSDWRHSAYLGNVKLILPTRTIGLAGFVKDEAHQNEFETKLSWDMDRDTSKQVGVRASLQKASHTQADISLILPKETHVDSKLIMNKGNTILEGQTQIFYSQDSSKTLTLFSKIENQPSQHSYFYAMPNELNYSIEVGMSHPESRIDMKMASHLGSNDDRLTTSLGLNYLNSKKQMKNMDLFLEINKLKKEINLYTKSPYKTMSISGAVKSENPLEVRVATTVDGEDQITSTLKVNREQKKVQVTYANKDKKLEYEASFPNKTALQFVRNKVENGHELQDIKVLIHLPSPQTLQTNLHWKPGMLAATRDTFADIMQLQSNSWKEFVDQVEQDLEQEVTEKYKDIASSVIDDIKSIVDSMQEEIKRIEEDMDKISRDIQEEFDICSIQIGDYELKDDIALLQTKMQSKVEKITSAMKSYTKQYRDSLQSLSETLDEIKDLAPQKFYSTIMNELAYYENYIFKSSVIGAFQYLNDISHKEMNQLWKYVKENVIEKQWDPKPLIESFNQKVNDLMRKTVSTDMTDLWQENPEVMTKVKTLLHVVKKAIVNSHMSNAITKTLEDSHSEIYQVAKWSVEYLEIDEIIPRRMDDLAELVQEIIKEELKVEMQSMSRLLRNPITKFDPEQGVLQAQLPLLFPVHRLDQIPTFQRVTSNTQHQLENVSAPVHHQQRSKRVWHPETAFEFQPTEPRRTLDTEYGLVDW